VHPAFEPFFFQGAVFMSGDAKTATDRFVGATRAYIDHPDRQTCEAFQSQFANLTSDPGGMKFVREVLAGAKTDPRLHDVHIDTGTTPKGGENFSASSGSWLTGRTSINGTIHPNGVVETEGTKSRRPSMGLGHLSARDNHLCHAYELPKGTK
jgi:hypothetical protein